MKVYVKIGCIDKSRTPYTAGEIPDIDKEINQKLWDLGLVENYDEKKHGKAPETSDGALKVAEAEIVKLRDEIKSLEGNNQGGEQLDLANEKITTLENANKGLEEGKIVLDQTIATQLETINAFEESDTGKLKKEITVLKGKNTKLQNEITSLKAE